MVCGGETGRFEVAHEIVRHLGLEREVTITLVSSAYFREAYLDDDYEGYLA